MKKNLVIVESPAKAKTIQKFLGKDYNVKSSYGHIRDLSPKKLSVDIENNFEPQYEIPKEKKKVVTELKKAAKEHQTVWLATDEDREGEAIAWHLLEALQLKDKDTKRIAFHEITKDAIKQAIESPRSINYNLVNAQQARRILDRLVGYELSPLLWKKVKPALSAGRVQSVAVRLIVEREEEIENFKPESYFKLQAVFVFEGSDGKVHELYATLSDNIKSQKEVIDFLELIKNAGFKITSIEKKEAVKNPPPPFTTSTLQQEASRKLGLPVNRTMRLAQKLYEEGHITYMRTDSVHLSNLAINTAKKVIAELYGNEYSQPRQYQTKIKSAQEAHEAIRPTYINKQTISGTEQEKKLYELIWKRTIASQMKSAKFERTIITIGIQPPHKYHWRAEGEILLFDGFLKVYREASDDEKDDQETKLLPKDLNKNVDLKLKEVLALEKFTRHLPRYTEASLVKKLEELGIGRPSTYAPIISTIQERKYVERKTIEGEERRVSEIKLSDGKISNRTKKEKTGYEKNKLVPTDIGRIVNSFLLKYFPDIVDYNFTATVEKQFDIIAEGKLDWRKMIADFYKDFHNKIEETTTTAKKELTGKELGKDPKSGKPIFAKIGRYGPYIQVGDSSDEEKPKFYPIPPNKSIHDITLDYALKLINLNKKIGTYEGKDITVGIGKYGPYINWNGKFFAIPKKIDITEITEWKAIEIIDEKIEKEQQKFVKQFENDPDLQILKGRWGNYIKYKGKNYRIPKEYKGKDLSYEDCMKIISEAKGKK
jgi:DNA topoisomerase-1